MIDLREINETIDQLRRKGNTIQAAEQLALLYITRDYLQHEEREREEHSEREKMSMYSQAAAPSMIVVEPHSEFLSACNSAPMDDVFAILDAHMETIRVLYPREYDAIVGQIEKIDK